jgi:hypothetical protein
VSCQCEYNQREYNCPVCDQWSSEGEAGGVTGSRNVLPHTTVYKTLLSTANYGNTDDSLHAGIYFFLFPADVCVPKHTHLVGFNNPFQYGRQGCIFR